MRRLHDQSFYSVIQSPVKRLFYIVDGHIVPFLHMVNDNLACKSSSHGIFLSELFIHRLLDCPDGETPVIIVARSKAYYQQFLFPDIILISRIIQICVSCFIIFSVILGCLCIFTQGS